MTVEEISNVVAQRLLQGSMNHQQFSDYFNFLGLEGYKDFHEYQFYEQSCGFTNFGKYVIQHYNRLIPKFSYDSLVSIQIIPDNWYNYIRQDVDTNTKRNAVKNGLQKHLHWEQDSKRIYEDMYGESMSIHEAALGFEIQKYICGVNKEIKDAKNRLLEIRATDFDMPTIITAQKQLKEKYGQKIKNLRKEFGYVKSQRS